MKCCYTLYIVYGNEAMIIFLHTFSLFFIVFVGLRHPATDEDSLTGK